MCRRAQRARQELWISQSDQRRACHVRRACRNAIAAADRGVYIEYDSLGREHYTDEWGYGFAAAVVNSSGKWFYGLLFTQTWRAVDPTSDMDPWQL